VKNRVAGFAAEKDEIAGLCVADVFGFALFLLFARGRREFDVEIGKNITRKARAIESRVRVFTGVEIIGTLEPGGIGDDVPAKSHFPAVGFESGGLAGIFGSLALNGGEGDAKH